MSHDPTTDTTSTTTPATEESTSPATETLSQETENTSGDNGTVQNDDLINQIIQLREQLARSQADYSNLVRRTREESAQMGEWIENKTIMKFLPTLDNLERSLEHIPAGVKSDTWTEGLHSIVRGLAKVFTDLGAVPMKAVGSEVNPDLHEVISQVPSAQTTIIAEVEKGYTRHSKALRHAKVIVGNGEV